MAVVTNLPFHDNFRVTAIYGQTGSMWSLGFHTGIDLVAVSDTTIYATCDGIVYSKGYSNSYGNYVFVYDSTTRYYHHFCHMQNPCSLNVGDTVNRNTGLGVMGATGNVTGAHLHYELMQNSTQFLAENFLNPSIWLGIPNEIGLYNWEDYPITPPTPPPTTVRKKHKYKFVLFKKKRLIF